MSYLTAGMVDPTACVREEWSSAERLTSLFDVLVLLGDATLNKRSEWGAGMLDAAAGALSAAQCRRVDIDPLDVRPGQLWVESVAVEYDAVVLAAGDCITCTSRAARNVVLAERAGIPGALVCTAATESVARAVGQSLGLPGVHVLPVPESLFGRSRREVTEIVAPHLAGLAPALTDADAAPSQGGR